jgi:hypothetical protein
VARQRGNKGGRVTPKGRAPTGRMTSEERAGLEDIFAKLLRSASKELTDALPPVAIEMWASQMWSVWAQSELIGADAIEVFAGGLIRYSAKQATPAALLVLRALASVAPPPYGEHARREVDRLAAGGVPERRWATAVGTGDPTVAWLSSDPIDDDGVSVMIGFDGPGEPCTIGVYIDHNLGGSAKDAFVVPASVDEVLARLRESDEGFAELEYRSISLTEASARCKAAFDMTDMTLDPPTSEDLDHLRALVVARLAKLPAGGAVPGPAVLEEDERERVLAEFLESDDITDLRPIGDEQDQDEVVEHLAHHVMTYSLEYAGGTPLRFSPVMAELFCLDWAPRKIAADGDAFRLLPDVLAAWIRFVGRRRGIPHESVRAAVEAAYDHAPEMIELSEDPETWGPAKTMTLAIEQRGIDITDQAALDEFVAEVNRKGGIDVLAHSLAPRR